MAPAPDPANGHAYVDLGLRRDGNKILFATMNIGATSPEDSGDYFAWGETSKRYTSLGEFGVLIEDGDDVFYGRQIVGNEFDYENAPFSAGTYWSYTKYNSSDNKQTLDASDDVAVALWGGNWRMPDKMDLEFLLNETYCTVEWNPNFNSTGVAGLVVSGKGDYSENRIFLPVTDCADGDAVSHLNEITILFYWSRSLVQDNADMEYAYSLHLEGDPQIDDPLVDGMYRYDGLPVRPVLVIPE